MLAPGDRGGEATQDVAGLLAAITLPSIEPFGPDNPVLAGLPNRVSSLTPDPEPASKLEVARGVYDAAVAALVAVKQLEDSLSACKAGVIAQFMGAAEVEAAATGLDAWQAGVSHASACTEIATALCIPEPTAASLAHHCTMLVRDHQNTMAALETGVLSYRHACIIVDEIETLCETASINTDEVTAFESRLLGLAPGTTAAAFGNKARRARETTYPQTLKTRTRQAFTRRAMTLEAGKDGMSWMTFHLPSIAAEGIWVNCTRIAREIKNLAREQQKTNSGQSTGTGEFRTLTQLRIDVAAALLLNQQPLPATSGTRAGTANSKARSAGVAHEPSTTGGPSAGSGPDYGDGTGGPGAAVGGFPNCNTTCNDDPANSNAAGSYAAGSHAAGSHGGGSDTTDSGGPANSADTDGAPFGSRTAFGVSLIQEEPVWAHSIPDGPGSSDIFTSSASTGSPGSGNFPTGEASLGGVEDAPVCGEVVGDGSGFVEGIVDGIPEDHLKEYLEQLDDVRAHHVITGPPLPEATILLTVPFLGLLNITDEPADLVGARGGPVPADIAAKLIIAAGTFVRVLTDPITGEPLPLNPERYRLREAETSALRLLAGGCYFPNCPNPVMDTDTDHLIPREKGGKSTLENQRPACKRHHMLKHFKDDKDKHGNRRRFKDPTRNDIRMRGWTPLTRDNGGTGWISPTGKYHEPLCRERSAPRYPKWLKKRMDTALNRICPDSPEFSPLEQKITIKYFKKHTD